MPLKIVETEDGTITCFDEHVGENFHNRASACREALFNFVLPAGLCQKAQACERISVLDAPFGLGYNTFVLLQTLAALPPGCLANVDIVAIESNPEPMQFLPRVIAQEQFAFLRSRLDNVKDVLAKLAAYQTCEFALNAMRVQIDLRLCDMRLQVPILSEQSFDAIFHDPFSPRQMPELWTVDIFKIYHRLIAHSGRIVTYSAATAVRAGLIEAGFFVYRTAAVGSKSGGTMASDVALADLPGEIFMLDAAELSKLGTRSAVPYRDASFMASRLEVLRSRQIEQALL